MSRPENEFSEHNETQRQRESPYAFAYFVLTDDRAHLYERINRRVDQMIEEGLVNEVQALKDKGYTKQLVFHAGTWLQRNSGLSGWQLYAGRSYLYN